LIFVLLVSQPTFDKGGRPFGRSREGSRFSQALSSDAAALVGLKHQDSFLIADCRGRRLLMSAPDQTRAPDTVSVMITAFIGRDRLNRLVIPSPGTESPDRLAAICFDRKPVFPSASASACCVVQFCHFLWTIPL